MGILHICSVCDSSDEVDFNICDCLVGWTRCLRDIMGGRADVG